MGKFCRTITEHRKTDLDMISKYEASRNFLIILFFDINLYQRNLRFIRNQAHKNLQN